MSKAQGDILDKEVSPFFGRGKHSAVRRWVSLLAAGAVILGVIWLLEEGAAPSARANAGVGSFVSLGENGASDAVAAAPRIGNPAPDFQLASPGGKTLSLSGLRGKSVVVNFWATWCPPCRAEMPELEALYQKYKDEGVVMVAVNLREDPKRVKRYADALGLTFPIVLDSLGETFQAYGVLALPTTVFVDSNGVVREINVGAMSGKTMETKLTAARR